MNRNRHLTLANLYLASLLALAVFLIFFNLGAVHLWEDEAETALVAKTIWTGGIPRTTDGINFFYQEQGKRVGFGTIWAWTPWLQFYAASLSLKLLGWNAWAARLPFAVAGFVALTLLFKIAASIFDCKTAFLATLLCACSVPFLLYVRQCRYYPFVFLTILWTIDSINGFQRRRRLSGISLFCALFLLFHANYLTWFGVWFSIWIYAFFLEADQLVRRKIRWILVWAALVNAPWFFLFKPLHEKARDFFDVGILIDGIVFYIEGLNHYVVPISLLIALPVVLSALPKKQGEVMFDDGQKKWIIFFAVLTGLTVFFALFGPAINTFRYVLGAIPILVLLLSLILVRIWIRSKILGTFFISMVLLTNVFNVLFYPLFQNALVVRPSRPSYKFGFPLVTYLGELFNPPHGATRALVSFLKQKASPSDLVLATYGNLPIMFYTGLRVIGGLSIEAVEEAPKADWIVSRKVVITHKDGLVMLYLLSHLPWERYEKIELPETDYPWEYIPEPQSHQFRPLSFDPLWKVEIYRKLTDSEPSRNPDPPKRFYFVPMEKSIEGTDTFKREFRNYLLWLKERTSGK